MRTLTELDQMRERLARGVPSSRELALALTKLDEAKLWLREAK